MSSGLFNLALNNLQGWYVIKTQLTNQSLNQIIDETNKIFYTLYYMIVSLS